MADRELVITLEGGHWKAYATRFRNGERSGIQYGCQGTDRQATHDGIRQLFEEFMADEIPEGGMWRRVPVYGNELLPEGWDEA